MSKQNLTQHGLVGMALVLFLGGGFVTGSNYWIQQYDYVVKVNEHIVRSADYLRRMEQNKQIYANLPDAENLLKKLTVNELIEREIHLLESDKQALQVTPQEIEQEWQQILNASYQGNKERMLRSLSRLRYSESSFKKELLERILVRKVQEQLTAKVQIPEDKLKKYYSENKKNFQRPEQIEALHILFKVDTTNPKSTQQALEKANKTLKEIQNGLDFSKAAIKYSEDGTTAKQGGSLEAFGKGDMVPAFEKSAWNLKPNEMTTAPVKTEYGYHLIQRGKTIAAGDIPFAEARSIFEPRLRIQAQQEYAKDWLSKQKTSMVIQIHPKYQESSSEIKPSSPESTHPIASTSP